MDSTLGKGIKHVYSILSTLGPYDYVKNIGSNEMEIYNLETDLSE